ncbi:LacI family DNA-binding transcriptional regulator [Vibrio sp. CDRSL-10 TSBA]
MVTMQDVARYAGVSKSTVSRVINGHSVSADVTQKVSTALQRLGYHPNRLARALTTNRNSVVGVIIAESSQISPAVIAFLSHLLAHMSRLHRPLMVLQLQDQYLSHTESVQALAEQRCECIVCVSAGDDLDKMMSESFQSVGIPLALVEMTLCGHAILSLKAVKTCPEKSSIQDEFLSVNQCIEQIIANFIEQ